MKTGFRHTVWPLALFAGVLAAQSPPAADNFVQTHYAKHEYRIPMRDGVTLYAAAYAPLPQAVADGGPYPFLVTRTPYGCAPYGETNLSPRIGLSRELLESGYIFVCEDVRGRGMSQGIFTEMSPHIDNKAAGQVDESTDMYDTVEFLLHHIENNNGNVGIAGYSYMGFYTAASIIDSHPAIKAASPQAPMTDLYFNDDWYHGGAFMEDSAFGFYTSHWGKNVAGRFDYGTADGYRFFLNVGPTRNLQQLFAEPNPYFTDVLTHTTYDDYWKQRDLSRHMSGVHAAVLVVGGWFDAEDLSGPFKTFHAIDEFNPHATNSLIMGPWSHGGWNMGDGDRLGDVTFGQPTAAFFRSQIEFPFFEHFLKGRDAEPLPKAYVFETGSNIWKKYAAWPPPAAVQQTLYFHAGGKLSFDPPTERVASDQYLSDPAHPVPFINYTALAVPPRYMSDDQRFASERPDVLTYETDPLPHDLTLVGPVKPMLKIASTGTDADFIVKLIDVYPDNTPSPTNDAPVARGARNSGAIQVQMGGYEQLVRGEPMRAKFRDSWQKPTPLVPGKMVAVNSEMPDINHTFLAGHRIMAQIQSSWFPLIDRNPQTFTDIPSAKPEQFVKATQTVYRDADAASGIGVLMLPATPDLTGYWRLRIPTGDGVFLESYIRITQTGESIAGTISGRGPNGTPISGTFHDGKLHLATVPPPSPTGSAAASGSGFRQQVYDGTYQDNKLLLQTQNRQGTVEGVAERTTREATLPPAPLPLPALRDLPDNGLARTPPMGWNSWNKFAGRIRDADVRAMADAMVSSGMSKLGYVYLNIDDTWEGGRDSAGNLQSNSKFPDMKALADYVHSKGLKIGIYSSPGPKTCAGYEGSFGHEDQDARTFASWGIDYLKYDLCTARNIYASSPETLQALYQKMGEALQKSGRPIVFSLCEYGNGDVWTWGAKTGGNLWRTTGDIRDDWASMDRIGFSQVPLAGFNRPGHWNDPDMLEIGNGGMNVDEYRTHMSLWSLLSAPLIAGNDLRSMSEETRSILTNAEAISIDQDPSATPVQILSQKESIEILRRSMQDGSIVVGIFNRGNAATAGSLAWASLNLGVPANKLRVRDLWRHEDVEIGSESYTVTVPPHGVALLRVTVTK